MNLQKTLILCGIVAVVLLVLQFISQVHRIKNGRENTGHNRVFINWLLVLVIIGGFGGGIYLAHQPKHEVAQPVKTTTPTTSKESDDKVTVEFDRKVELNDQGERKVKFNVSEGTKVRIVGHYSKKVFKTFNDQTEFSYTFDNPGTYDIIATKGDKKVVKKLVVKDYSGDDEDSSSSSSASSTASSQSESSRSSSNNSNSSRSQSSGNSNSGSSASNGGGSRSTGGGGSSAYTGGGSAYTGGGGGGATYTPSRPASTPSAPSNGTGAMTGGNY
ncbi:hypothetical protein [Limosilactobacillus sp.]|uniref:hypothetical protein n=1 Tax=Limosilactobacillus sp. TaxID=2773925 RepID=UPI003F107D66